MGEEEVWGTKVSQRGPTPGAAPQWRSGAEAPIRCRYNILLLAYYRLLRRSCTNIKETHHDTTCRRKKTDFCASFGCVSYRVAQKKVS